VLSPPKGHPTKHCTGLPNARFFGDGAPAKMPLVEASLAGPAAGECRRWAAAAGLVYRFRFIAFYYAAVGVSLLYGCVLI